jgi:hypothetical protein
LYGSEINFDKRAPRDRFRAVAGDPGSEETTSRPWAKVVGTTGLTASFQAAFLQLGSPSLAGLRALPRRGRRTASLVQIQSKGRPPLPKAKVVGTTGLTASFQAAFLRHGSPSLASCVRYRAVAGEPLRWFEPSREETTFCP